HLAPALRDSDEHALDGIHIHEVGAVVARLDLELRLDPGALALDLVLLAEPVEEDAGALGGKRPGDRQSDAAGRSGHQRELVLEHSIPLLTCVERTSRLYVRPRQADDERTATALRHLPRSEGPAPH